ncbi:site-specific DNA-methyltransferase [Mycoplasmopsis felifaucium]|uniref:site-specific DNA-methyltransferase n=1 Tax=Mycoplasmopsis felifaucium TaxID=35768 RepID=UPI00047F8EA5|nr:site-specific DNA-methyltransferase [Mycoplasmopsis felifaucium]
MATLKEEYLKKADGLSLTNEINQDQKDLIKTIINKFDDNDKNLQNVYQFLIKRVKLGFTFDIAPSVDSSQVALLVKNEQLSFKNNFNDNQNNLIIGENYDALKNLISIEREREDRESNYDIIYIDPPYNTEASRADGNNLSEKDDVSNDKFIYRDKFSRTGWLNMLNERLIMARQLLKEDGVIFVSIDDNEQAYLKVLMDEIFGEENFISCITWQKKNEGSASDSSYIKNITEYILVYAKNLDEFKPNHYFINVNKETYKYSDEYINERGKYLLKQLDGASITWSHGMDYIIEHNGNQYFAGGSKDEWVKRHNGLHAFKDWCWRWSSEKVKWGLDNGYIVFKNGKVYSKQYQFVDNEGNKIDRTSKFSNLILDIHNTLGTKEIRNIFNRKSFDHPKPSILLLHLINLHPNPNARVLDFYAGSGTTGHAVLELNKEDGGSRTFTLVTNNENNIGTNVCYERLYRINNGKGTKEEQDFDWIKKNEPYEANLNVFELKYFNTALFNNEIDIEKIKSTYIKELNDFGINTSNLKTIDILNDLTALKPIEKTEDKFNETK